MSEPFWQGVFPAITTQFKPDQSIDLEATANHTDVLIKSGVAGLIFLGSLGENQPMRREEKRVVIEAMVKAVDGRVKVLSGVAESSTDEACAYVRDVEKLGVDGVMVMPAMLYKGDERETLTHFRTVANASGLPIMIYNNPVSYANDVTPEMFAQLADQKNFVALKESSGDVRRITDLRNTVGDRYAIFTGVDDLALEASILGIDGWVAGSGIAFPYENQYFWQADSRRRSGKRRASSTGGSRRCSIWTPAQNLYSTSNWRCRNADWERNGCARRGCHWPAPNGNAYSKLSTTASPRGHPQPHDPNPRH